jgi:hypothetical protein
VVFAAVRLLADVPIRGGPFALVVGAAARVVLAAIFLLRLRPGRLPIPRIRVAVVGLYLGASERFMLATPLLLRLGPARLPSGLILRAIIGSRRLGCRSRLGPSQRECGDE